MSAETIQLGEFSAEVVLKDIKNLHLSVYPPHGAVRISAPRRMKLETIRVFAISRLGWIKQQRTKLRAQERETPREYLDRESHFVWGRRFLLQTEPTAGAAGVGLQHRTLILRLRPGASAQKKHDVLEAWYREQVKESVPPLIAKWEPILGVSVQRFFVRRMKTKWGSCSPSRQTIRLNTDLARKPRECLEYLIVHEMVHLLEPTHNARFVALMDHFMPQWQLHRAALNRLPVRHEDWAY